MVSICISLVISDEEHLVIHMLAICMSFGEKCLYRSFTHFNRVIYLFIYLFILSFMRSLYILIFFFLGGNGKGRGRESVKLSTLSRLHMQHGA